MNFIKESTEEIRKVTWPTRNQAVTLSIIVIIFTALSTLLFLGSDRFFRAGYDALLETSNKVENQAPIEAPAHSAPGITGEATGETITIEGEDGPIEVDFEATETE